MDEGEVEISAAPPEKCVMDEGEVEIRAPPEPSAVKSDQGEQRPLPPREPPAAPLRAICSDTCLPRVTISEM